MPLGVLFLMRIKNLSFIITVFFVVLFLSGCNDDPTLVGYNLQYDTASFVPIGSDIYPLITEAKPFKQLTHIFNTGATFIGSYNGYKAVTMMLFADIPDSLEYVTSDNIISADLVMTARRYTFGDSISNNLSFKVFKFNRKQWFKIDTTGTSPKLDSTLSWEKIYGSSSTSDFFDYSKTIAQYSQTIPLGDSVQISMPFDKDLITEWFKVWNNVRKNGVKDTIFGISMVPDDASGIIRQFSTVAVGDTGRSKTKIIVSYRDKNSEIKTATLNGVVEASILTGPAPDPGTIALQGALSYRTQLWFDVSQIPKYSSIHTAQLEIYRDDTKCIRGNTTLDSIVVAELDIDAADTTLKGYARTYAGKLTAAGSDKYYFYNMSSAVEEWTRRGGKGALDFRYYNFNDEYRKMDRLVFHGMNTSDKTKLPKLKIIYSMRPTMNKGK